MENLTILDMALSVGYHNDDGGAQNSGEGERTLGKKTVLNKKILKIIAAVLTCCLLVVAAVWGVITLPKKTNLYQTSVFVMDTVVDIKLYGASAEPAAQEIIAKLRESESALSLYIPGSDISRINAAAGSGEFVPVSKETFFLLQDAKAFYNGTQGRFDVTVAPLSLLWDISGENPHVPDAAAIRAALALVNADDLLLDVDTRSARLKNKGQGVDLGGMVKGASADMAITVMKKNSIENGYVSLGGNLAVRGAEPVSGEDFVFGVRDPLGSGNDYIATMTLSGKTMATSGDYERFFVENGVRYHHILNPKTGYPANNGIISISVVGDKGIQGDLLSTALFIQGRDEVLKLFMNDSRFSVIMVDSDKNVYVSSALEGIVKPNAGKPEYKFQFVKPQ